MPAVVIVGAGPAGAALALALGRQGIEVALFDKAAFPRDKACGEGLMPSGVAVLQRLGLESVMRAALPFWGIRYHAGDRLAMGRFPRVAGAPSFGLGQRRLGLDHRLVEAAIAHPTVEWRPAPRVGGLLRRGDRVVGVEVAEKPFKPAWWCWPMGSIPPFAPRRASREPRTRDRAWGFARITDCPRGAIRRHGWTSFSAIAAASFM
jgi:2-polyprenyl-6-methoxyphenol hydroxylase-like FAD-dependent oxidoreductase